MAIRSGARTPPRTHATRSQDRADRTRELVIEETIQCIREEGFAAASTRRIIERAGVSSGVIQYHFGDREGLLTAVIDHALVTLAEAMNDLADAVGGILDIDERMHALAEAAWTVFFNPASMTAMEILIATRAMRGRLSIEQLADLQPGLARIAEVLDEDSPSSAAIANLLWAAPVGLMVGQLVTSQPLLTEPEQQAMAHLLVDHLRCRSNSFDQRSKTH